MKRSYERMVSVRGNDSLMDRVKEEVESDIEVDVEIAEPSTDGSCDEAPAVILTTNYHDTRLPMLEDFRGPYNFSYRLPREGTSSIKPTWEYSDVFNQVFIKMDRVLVVQFSFDKTIVSAEDLYIRAVLVYSSADHVFLPVNRCAVHVIEDDPMSKSHADKDRCLCPFYELAGHVVRCKSTDAMYCYDPKSERHSVLCPVKNTSDILYSFRCKNSCPRGMQRRTTKLVFTLENGSGKMLGRTSVDIKICSCPRRDREKAEKTLKYSQGNSCITGSSAVPSPPLCRPGAESPPAVLIRSSNVSVQLEESNFEEDDYRSSPVTHLPGEVIMRVKSEVRNIRQALVVIERRCSHVMELLNTQQDS